MTEQKLLSRVAAACLMTLGLVACGGGSTDETVSADTAPHAQAAAAVPVRVDETSSWPYLGIGINGLSYYDGAYAMADVVHESQFRSGSWGTPPLDANGAPTQDALLIFSSRRMGAGTYKLVFKGQAVLGVSGEPEDGSGNRPSIQNQRYTASTNTTTADLVIPVTLRDNAWLTFGSTRRTATATPGTGISEVRLWRPGYPTDGSVTFTREFIAAMQKFHVIRGMDFAAANSNADMAWSDRTNARHIGAVAAGKGQPWELLVQLANATGNDLWINVPARADDTYLTRLAQLLRYGSDGVNPYTAARANPVWPPLKAGLKVYVELGNELWNWSPGFQGYGWSLALADAARKTAGHPVNYDGAVDATSQDGLYLAHRRWIAYRSSQVSLAFRKVWGDAAMMTTVRPVLASQVADGNGYLSEALRWAEGYYSQLRVKNGQLVKATTPSPARKVSELWWGGGGAAYYESSHEPVDPTDPAQRTAFFEGLPSPQFASNTAIDATWTRGYGLKSVAYEGGPGPGGSPLGGSTWAGAVSAAYNADPRLLERMHAAHQIYQASGGQMLNYYVYSGAGPWEFTNGVTPGVVSDTDTVKLRAIDAIRLTRKNDVTLGQPVPGTVWLQDAATFRQSYGGTGGAWGYDGQAIRFGPGTRGPSFAETVLLPVRSTSGGTYGFSIRTYDAPANAQVELLVNGSSAGTWKLAASSTGQPVASTALRVTLPAGLSVVRLRPLNNLVWIRDLVVQ